MLLAPEIQDEDLDDEEEAGWKAQEEEDEEG